MNYRDFNDVPLLINFPLKPTGRICIRDNFDKLDIPSVLSKRTQLLILL